MGPVFSLYSVRTIPASTHVHCLLYFHRMHWLSASLNCNLSNFQCQTWYKFMSVAGGLFAARSRLCKHDWPKVGVFLERRTEGERCMTRIPRWNRARETRWAVVIKEHCHLACTSPFWVRKISCPNPRGYPSFQLPLFLCENNVLRIKYF